MKIIVGEHLYYSARESVRYRLMIDGNEWILIRHVFWRDIERLMPETIIDRGPLNDGDTLGMDTIREANKTGEQIRVSVHWGNNMKEWVHPI